MEEEKISNRRLLVNEMTFEQKQEEKLKSNASLAKMKMLEKKKKPLYVIERNGVIIRTTSEERFREYEKTLNRRINSLNKIV